MIYLGVWFLVLGVSAAQAANITQQTQGYCSPAVGQTGGNVIMNFHCPGIDPQALDALNRELGLTKGQLRLTNQQLEQKTKEANEWASKYHELSRQAKATQDKQLGRQAEALLLDGKLEQADILLKRSFVNMTHYNAVQKGMSYQQVANIVGLPGVEEARSGSGDITVTHYKWKNPDQTYLGVTFINDQMTGKHNGELRYP